MAFLFLECSLREMKSNSKWRKWVLRITEISESADSITLKVEGRIVSEWVTVLEQECLKWLRAKPEVLLDFSEVTFIERNGVAMLMRIASPRLRLINCPALIAELLNGNNNQYWRSRCHALDIRAPHRRLPFAKWLDSEREKSQFTDNIFHILWIAFVIQIWCDEFPKRSLFL